MKGRLRFHGSEVHVQSSEFKVPRSRFKVQRFKHMKIERFEDIEAGSWRDLPQGYRLTRSTLRDGFWTEATDPRSAVRYAQYR